MPIAKQKIEDLVSLMQKTYPGWTNFSDSSYLEDETDYKREAIAKAKELLSEAELSRLLDENKFDEIISRLKSIANATNLLWTNVPSTGDLAILEDDKLDKQSFCRQIFQLLHGSSPSQDRLDGFLKFVKDNGLPNKWTFPTYFLFMCHPDTEMFIKPKATKAFFKYLGVEDLGFNSTPSGETYFNIKEISHQLKDDLIEYKPQDMVDIQSLIFVCYNKKVEAIFDGKELELERLLNPRLVKNVWWVNQGSSIKEEQKDGVLCAPKKSEGRRFFSHWERLVEIVPEDIILHYANGKLLYVGRATASAVAANRPYGRYDEVNMVQVDYHDLIPPIPLSKFSGDLQELAIKDGPLNTNGGVKEGYLWRLTSEALKFIQTDQPETKWPEFALLGISSSWIFQANPNTFDINESINEINEMTWKVDQHRDKIHANDTVYLWKSGEDAGIVGVAKILSEESDEFFDVRISIERILEKVISPQELLNDPLLKSMQILRQPQGTIFALTDEEAKAIKDLIRFPRKNLDYSLEQCSKETGLDKDRLDSWIKAIHRKGQAIIYGPPGTGKTFVADHIARHLIGGGYGFKDIIQFHPAYSYEDFIQGIRPKIRDDDGNLEYSIIPGQFLNFCNRARNCNGMCVLIIDEINRANLARVFGELMYLLEYRGKKIQLAAGEGFSIPENVRIIGTMNTADRSIALVDHALRRRFAFLRLQPEYGILRMYHEQKRTGFPVDGLIQVLKGLNEDIRDPQYEVGISYFINEDLDDQLEDIWKMEIEPYLEEYFFHDKEKLNNYRWKNIMDRINQ